MEEILASIRRIISDDETSAARPRAAPVSLQDDDGLEVTEGEADNKIIDDIARVLSGGAPAPVVEEEEILDLTAELGGLELVEEEPEQPAQAAAAAVSETVLVQPAPARPAEVAPSEPARPAEAASSEPAPEVQAAPSEPARPAPGPTMQATQPPAEQVQQPQAPQAAAPARPRSASEEAASALERAIAALRAGQVPTSAPTSEPMAPFAFESEIQAEPAPPAEPLPAFQVEPEPMFQVEPEPALQAEPEPALQAEMVLEAELAPEAELPPEMAPEPAPAEELEPELVLTEIEVSIESEEPLGAEAMMSEPEEAPFWPREAPSWPRYAEPEGELAESPQANGSGPYEDYGAEESAPAASPLEGAKSLEESIKDMLRPMLRQWLDENMPRVLTAALKDELSASGRQQD
jgi:hypothetical protein